MSIGRKTIIPANSGQRIVEVVQAALSIHERSEEGVAVQVIDQIRS